MQLTHISIRRPLFMLMVISGLLVVGFVSWSKLGVDLFPAVDFPIVVVNTLYPGASPEAIDTLITQPVEDAVASMSDIDHIDSTTTEGSSLVIINFTDRAPMAVTVIGGLLTSTLLTLVLIPAVYTIMDDLLGGVARVIVSVRKVARAPIRLEAAADVNH
jgi:multidrug efflux pump subunit AcrB